MKPRSPRSRKQQVATKRNWEKARLASARGTLFDLERSPHLSPIDKARLSQAANLLKPLLEKWDADTKAILSETKNDQNFYITFMQKQTALRDHYWKISAKDYTEARDIATNLLGDQFAFMYTEEDFLPQKDRFNLTAISRNSLQSLL